MLQLYLRKILDRVLCSARPWELFPPSTPITRDSEVMKVAVVGSGVSGLAATWVSARRQSRVCRADAGSRP